MLSWLREYRRRRYVEGLVRLGLRLGRNVFLNDGFFLDPSHCHLITIEDGVVFGPRVTVLAHDASSLKIVGKTRIQAVHIRRGAFVGAGAVLLPGSELGEGSILGAGSILRGHVPPREVWAGNPARFVSTVSDYQEKLQKLEGRDFSESEYRIDLLTESTRLEMQSQVTVDHPGFMVDRDTVK